MSVDAVLALDPGKTTGWARWSNADIYAAGEVDFDGVTKLLRDFAYNYGSPTNGTPRGVIVCESFIINQNTPKNTQAPWSLELIGVARMFSREHMHHELTLQTPAAAKRFSTDNRLRAVNFWTPAKGHANDAARHLLLYMSSRGLLSHETLNMLVDVI